jgi:hypothetical protein
MRTVRAHPPGRCAGTPRRLPDPRYLILWQSRRPPVAALAAVAVAAG